MMSIRYAQSLRYNISQCDYILESIGWPASRTHDENEQQEAIDFIHDRRQGYREQLKAL